MEHEIKTRITELEGFYEAAVQRELKMKELKKEIKLLKHELSVFEQNAEELLRHPGYGRLP